MSGVYLTWLADELRAAGVAVVEQSGWKTRARSSGGFQSGRPWIVMWHHTASVKSPEWDAGYMSIHSPVAPVANVLIARDGAVWVLAAGATNTNGAGQACPTSKGTVPANSMNSYAFGMEMANSGIGEPYPQAQIDAAFKVSNVVNKRLGNRPSDVCTHHDYAPTRKIDPATALAVQGGWQPRTINRSGTWNLADLRAECVRRAVASIVPPTDVPKEGDEMITGLWMGPNDPGVYQVCTNRTKIWCYPGTVDEAQALLRLEGKSDLINVQHSSEMFRAMGPVIGPRPDGVDAYGWKD